MTEFRNQLNAIAQAIPGKPQVLYTMSSEGPEHRVEWTAVVTIGGTEWGTGKGPNQGAAKECAAEIAIANLKSAGLIPNTRTT